MFEINDRMKEIRQVLKLSQAEFGRRINLSRDAIANLDGHRTEVKELTISAICDTFSVNEDWLRAGKGDMFKPTAKADQITDFAVDVIKEDGFRARFVAMLAEMSPEEWALMERMAHRLLDEKKE